MPSMHVLRLRAIDDPDRPGHTRLVPVWSDPRPERVQRVKVRAGRVQRRNVEPNPAIPYYRDNRAGRSTAYRFATPDGAVVWRDCHTHMRLTATETDTLHAPAPAEPGARLWDTTETSRSYSTDGYGNPLPAGPIQVRSRAWSLEDCAESRRTDVKGLYVPPARIVQRRGVQPHEHVGSDGIIRPRAERATPPKRPTHMSDTFGVRRNTDLE